MFCSAARFVVCETALEVRRVESAAECCGLFISKRVDVYGKQGHDKPLFCVFVMRWDKISEADKHVDSGSGSVSSEGADSNCSSDSNGIGSRATEVIPLYVRKECGCHTSDYDEVMKVLGRPLSSCPCGGDKDSSPHSKKRAAI